MTVGMRSAAIAAALLIGACSKVTQENFARIQEGMSITVSFVSGKIALKTFEKTKRAP